jgi:cellulose synthase/poly-beta-1,6-N-acetylglucosamine synthase-like glycosyltransferase
MLLIPGIVLLGLALLLFVPVSVLFIECLASLFPERRTHFVGSLPRPKMAVLVPAHNEATVIIPTLQNLLAQLDPDDRLVVIADNCTDETASIAQQMGATVIERWDEQRRGKGFALDFGFDFLRSHPPEVVVVVDADCLVAEGAIEKIACLAARSNRPVQATYLMARSATPSPKDAVSALAFLVKNLVRPSGLNRIGLPCLLTGTGMAFPWPVMQQVSLASGNIVEDMKLSLDFALAGYPPIFCRNAKVTGVLPQKSEAAKSQRTRWEHGHLQTLLTEVPSLIQVALRKQQWNLLAIALDLSVPPLSLLVAIWACLMLLALLLAMLGGGWLPSTLLAIEGGLILTAILGAWAKFARHDLPLGTLLSVPLYILWKIPLYVSFLVKPQTKWVRTERDAIDSSNP